MSVVQTTRPKIQRVYVTLTDPDTRKSVSFTAYGATPEQLKRQMTGKPSYSKPPVAQVAG